MSLLLEALKKAEKAKEDAQRRARSEAPGEPGLAIERPAPAEAGERREPVLTRDNLPEITSQPLEILSDELPTPKQAPAQPETAPRHRPESPAADSAGRAKAKKVFEAKFREPNPRLPFYITMGALGAFAFGTVVYFWMQLRPPPFLVNANPAPPAGETVVAAAHSPPARSSAAFTPAASTARQPVIPGLPAAAAPIVSEPRRLQPPPAAKAPVTPKAAPRRRAAAPPRPAVPERAAAPLAKRLPPRIHPGVESGYAAYLAGDLGKARAGYEQALREEPANRDALLGIAALDVKGGRYGAAEATYLRLLQSDPRDSEAQAALIALRGALLDPLVAESRVKTLLAADPEAHALHFTLGNQFAQQGRWAEAQQQYFKAFAAQPQNADFAYNLAVSLDHLREARPAREYYLRAAALGKAHGASFDLAKAEARAAQLAN